MVSVPVFLFLAQVERNLPASLRLVLPENAPPRFLTSLWYCVRMKKQADFQVTRYASLEAMRSDQMRYWRSRPGHERMEAVSDITNSAYAFKNEGENVPRLQRTLSRIQRTQG